MQLLLLIFALPLLAGLASRRLCPWLDPDFAIGISLFPCFCLWSWLEDRR